MTNEHMFSKSRAKRNHVKFNDKNNKYVHLAAKIKIFKNRTLKFQNDLQNCEAVFGPKPKYQTKSLRSYRLFSAQSEMTFLEQEIFL